MTDPNKAIHREVEEGSVEPQFSHFVNFTSCEELVLICHFWQMWNLRKVNFDNLMGVKFVLKLHILHFNV